jgi:retinol dehydrogenase 14
MKGKIVLVTGATGGLGFSASEAFAKAGATVVMSGRSAARVDEAAKKVRASTGSATIEGLVADLSDMESVRASAKQLLGRHAALHVLVNNAAVFANERRLVKDGFEVMFATNHLGPFLLTTLLLPALKAGAPSRVFNVTAPSSSTLDFDDLQGEKKFSALHAFGASKMANLLFTYELARRLEGTGVAVHAFFPGLIKSDLMREAAAPIRFGTRLFSRRPATAAEELVRLASAPEAAAGAGKFFKVGKAIRSAPYSYDAANQGKLWELSAKLAGVSRV